MTARQTYLTKVAVAIILSTAITVLLMLPAAASASASNLLNDPYRVETFSINTPGNLEVRTSGGHIEVEGSSGNEVRVEMYVRKNGRELSRGEVDLDDWDISITQSGNTVKANAKRKSKSWTDWGGNNNISISFTVYTPRQMSTDLKTSGGHIAAAGLEGNQNISTSGGHLELANLKGTVEARTSGGHIEMDGLQGDIEARTSGGHISAKQSEGSLRVRTSGGHINLDEISGSIEASTSGGSIKANLHSIGQFANLKTSGGNVSITIPKNMGFDINLRGSYVSTNLENFSGNIERNEVEGKLNGGGPQITARTSGGTVSLSFH